MKMFSPIRVLFFIISVYALSLFFDAGRLIANDLTFKYFSLSFLSLVLLLTSLFSIGYFVYSDEKEKGNLAKKFMPYEWVYNVLSGGRK